MTQLNLYRDKVVLLFYKKHKWDYLLDAPNRTVSGFYAWYLCLVDALSRFGYQVYENNYDLAQDNPTYPVGIVGTPDIMPSWDLPNPAILGPSMYDHPMIHPEVGSDPRFAYYLVTCEWMKNVFSKYYGEKCVLWYAGVDTDTWIDTANEVKDIDVLIYEKIRWNRSKKRELLLNYLFEPLAARDLSVFVLPYGNVSHQEYKNLLRRSRTMLFLCEYETQGMAYQEALASNVPILAWDPGYCIDPYWEIFERGPMPASSVPFFSSDCGERFQSIHNFEETLDCFWSRLEQYTPRHFACKTLSLKGSAMLYMAYYTNVYQRRMLLHKH